MMNSGEAGIGTHHRRLLMSAGGHDLLALEHALAVSGGDGSGTLRLIFGPPPETTKSNRTGLPFIQPANLRFAYAGLGAAAPLLAVVATWESDATSEPPWILLVNLVATEPGLLADVRSEMQLFRVTVLGVPDIHPAFDSADFRLDPGGPLAPEVAASSAGSTEPSAAIDYLSRNYAELRQLLLSRLRLESPRWQGESAADEGIMLVEVLAYAADYLAYYQDAVATETYLDTARLRISVRRHTRLLGYALSEGNNARAWIWVQVTKPLHLPAATQFLAGTEGLPTVVLRNSQTYERALTDQAEVYETLEAADLDPYLDNIEFITWGLENFALPAGSTSALLQDADSGQTDSKGQPIRQLDGLQTGAVLLLQQVINPATGAKSSVAGPRQVVRVRSVTRRSSGTRLWVQVGWATADALTFDLVVNARSGGRQIKRGALARGNLVVADAGRTVHQQLPIVVGIAPYRPTLSTTTLVFTEPFDPQVAREAPASLALLQEPGLALPAVTLQQTARPWLLVPPTGPASQRPAPPAAEVGYSVQEAGPATPEPPPVPKAWTPRFDLLASGPFATDFVVEISELATPQLRFGNGELGKLPAAGSVFTASYRVAANDTIGAVGPGTLNTIVSNNANDQLLRQAVAAVTNPQQSTQGREPQTAAAARRLAGAAYQRQQATVTLGDYVAIAERFPGVAQAVVRMGWNGSLPQAQVYVRRGGGQIVTPTFLTRLAAYLEEHRVAGRAIHVSGPRTVPLRVVMAVKVRSQVAAETARSDLKNAFSIQGFFDPDRLGFGESVFRSALVACALDLPGIVDAEVLTFERLDSVASQPAGVFEPDACSALPAAIVLASHEVARCDSDLRFWQNGGIEFQVEEATS